MGSGGRREESKKATVKRGLGPENEESKRVDRGNKDGGRLLCEAAPLFWPLSMKEITAPGNLHKHAPLLPPPLFMINEIRLAFAHRFEDVIADNCLSLPKLEAALVDAFITTVCSK